MIWFIGASNTFEKVLRDFWVLLSKRTEDKIQKLLLCLAKSRLKAVQNMTEPPLSLNSIDVFLVSVLSFLILRIFWRWNYLLNSSFKYKLLFVRILLAVTFTPLASRNTWRTGEVRLLSASFQGFFSYRSSPDPLKT